jgi:hypothetical protein
VAGSPVLDGEVVSPHLDVSHGIELVRMALEWVVEIRIPEQEPPCGCLGYTLQSEVDAEPPASRAVTGASCCRKARPIAPSPVPADRRSFAQRSQVRQRTCGRYGPSWSTVEKPPSASILQMSRIMASASNHAEIAVAIYSAPWSPNGNWHYHRQRPTLGGLSDQQFLFGSDTRGRE